jgi:release factor glutamine methyltransferase
VSGRFESEHTVGQWLTATADLPRRERDLLLSELTGLTRARVLAFPETPLQSQQVAALHQACEALRGGTPLAYVLGHQDFWTLRLQVCSDVLIPRPETELLVELALELAPRRASVLDLGTGSGAIAIAVAHSRRDLQVTAVERSPAALEVARGNAQRHAVAIEFIAGNWFENLSNTFDVIVCNPPYVAADDPHLQDLAAEPLEALAAGPQGLDDLERVISQAPQYLASRGYLAVEHGYDQAEAVRTLMRTAGFVDVRSVKDLAQIERATLGCFHGQT